MEQHEIAKVTAQNEGRSTNTRVVLFSAEGWDDKWDREPGAVAGCNMKEPTGDRNLGWQRGQRFEKRKGKAGSEGEAQWRWWFVVSWICRFQ